MRLTVPEPKIRLYEQGFEDIGEDGQKLDKLGRKQTGDKLSDLVERIDDPLVIALDGAWGSGKSFFLKCWVGEHLKREESTAQTVYFDAFQHDFLDDPLIALTGAIAERFEGKHSDGEQGTTSEAAAPEALAKLKKFGLFLGKAVGKAVVSAGANYAKKAIGEETFDALGDELKEAIGDGVDTVESEAKALFDADWGEAASKDFWKKQRAKTAAMEAFRLALTALTEPVTENEAKGNPKLKEGTPKRKLVIVIDELDRCRPDYALSLLEIIKHFFNVDGVHFVLGVNLKELQNSVRARYGSGVDAPKYLQKFVSIEMPLRSTFLNSFEQSDYTKHFDATAKLIGITEHPMFRPIRDYLDMANHHFPITLRDAEKLSTLIALTTDHGLQTRGERHLLAGLLVLRIVAPQLVKTARRGELSYNELDHAFLLNGRRSQGGYLNDARVVWLFATKTDPDRHIISSDHDIASDIFGDSDPKEVLRLVIANNLDTFILPYTD